MDWKKIWKKTYRTMAQTAIGLLSTCLVLEDIDWRLVVSATLLSGIVCALSGIADSDNTLAEADEDVVPDSAVEEEDPADDEVLPQ